MTTQHSTTQHKPTRHVDEAVVHFQRLTKPRGLANPYPEYAQLRALAPILKSPLPFTLGGYVLSRYQDCAKMLRDRTFVSMDPHRMDVVHPFWRDSVTARYVHQGIGCRNPPDHTRLRAAMSPHFTPRRIASLQSLISEIVDDLLDELAARGRREPVDFVETVAGPLPVALMRVLFGIDLCTARRLAALGHHAATILDLVRSPAQQRRMEGAGAELIEVFTALVTERSGSPDDSLLSSVIEACGGSDAADDGELIGNLMFLFTAGHETLVGFLGLAVRTLLAEPEQAELLRQNPDLAEAAVEELLRYDGSIQVAIRMAAEPVQLGDQRIEAGTTVLGLLGAANRDPDYVANPDTLDITRARVRPLSFGGGPHYCLGAFLARLEAQTLLPRLLRRFPRMRLADPPRYRSPGTTLRGIEQLPVWVHG